MFISVRAIRHFACLVVAAWVVSSFGAAQEEKKFAIKPPAATPSKAVFPPAEDKILKARKLPAEKIMGAGALQPGDEPILREYFGTLVKGFTIKEVIPGLWEVRQTMRQRALDAGKAPTNGAQIWLREFLFAEMKKLVADDKLPIQSRVNALLMIGDLNEKEPQLKNLTLEAPPVPLIAATPYLLQVFDNPQVPLPLRATALGGLHRHAELGVAPAHRPALLASMLVAVQDANLPKDCSPAAHEFLRRRAVEILGYLKDSSAAGPLVAIVGDAQASLAFRCDAARCLGLLTLKAGDPVAATPAVAQALGELAAAVAETETERRMLHKELDDVRTGLNGPNPKTAGGVRAATPQAQAKLAGDLFKLIDDFVKNIDPSNRQYKDEQLAEDVQTLAQDLRNTLPEVPRAKPKPAKKPESAKAKAETVDPATAAPVEPKKSDPKSAAPMPADKTPDTKKSASKPADAKPVDSKTVEPPKAEPAKTKGTP